MNDYFNATSLIPLVNNLRSKKVKHFLDNRSLTIPRPPLVTRGRHAYTELPIELLGEFLLWLTPKTRQAVLEGTSLEDIVKNIENYW